MAETKDANKRGALHFAAREAQTEVCKYLIEELKLDVDTKDEDGMYIFFIQIVPPHGVENTLSLLFVRIP